jgi:hypothetical protein
MGDGPDELGPEEITCDNEHPDLADVLCQLIPDHHLHGWALHQCDGVAW